MLVFGALDFLGTGWPETGHHAQFGHFGCERLLKRSVKAAAWGK